MQPSDQARLIGPMPIQPKGLPPEDATALCEDKPGGLAWIDQVQAGLYRTICLSAARFDGFFGNARFDDEYEATHGSLAVGEFGTSVITGIPAFGSA